MVIKQLVSRSDTELLGVWSGSKLFELLSTVVNSRQRVKEGLNSAKNNNYIISDVYSLRYSSIMMQVYI